MSVGMLSFRTMHATDWTGMAAGAVISLVPVMTIFILMQRYFYEGISGAVSSLLLFSTKKGVSGT